MGIISKAIRWFKKSRRAFRLAQTRWMVYSTIEQRIRSHFDYPPAHADKALDTTIRKGLDLFVVAGTKHAGEKALDDGANTIYEWLCSDGKSKKNLELHLRVCHLIESLGGDKESAHNRSTTYEHSFGVPLPRLNFAALSVLHSALKAQFDFNRARKRLTLFGAKELAQLFSIGSVLLLAAGYAHTSFVYNYFGIDPSRFFSIGGYLASSINQLASAVYSLVYFIFVMGAPYAYGSILSSIMAKRIGSAASPGRSLRQYLLYCSLAGVALFLLYKSDLVFFWLALPIAIYIFLGRWVNSLINKRITNTLSAKIQLTLGFFFIAAVILSILFRIEEIAEIKEGNLKETFVVKLEVGDHDSDSDSDTNETHILYTNETHIFLGGNDRYIFLLKKSGGTQIIPLEKVNEMDVFDTRVERAPLWLHRLIRVLRD